LAAVARAQLRVLGEVSGQGRLGRLLELTQRAK